MIAVERACLFQFRACRGDVALTDERSRFADELLHERRRFDFFACLIVDRARLLVREVVAQHLGGQDRSRAENRARRARRARSRSGSSVHGMSESTSIGASDCAFSPAVSWPDRTSDPSAGSGCNLRRPRPNGPVCIAPSACWNVESTRSFTAEESDALPGYVAMRRDVLPRKSDADYTVTPEPWKERAWRSSAPTKRRKRSAPTRRQSDATMFSTPPGQIALDPATGNLVEGDFAAQAHRVFANLKAVLAAGGADFSNVAKATVYLTDLANFVTLNEIYASYFGDTKPASRCRRRAVAERRVGRDRSDRDRVGVWLFGARPLSS